MLESDQKKIEKPYGTWPSPITSDIIVKGTKRYDTIVIDGENIYWTEMRPLEGGRSVVVKRSPDGKLTDLTPPEFNVRTRVHEYGGAAFIVSKGNIYFVNYKDQRVYFQNETTKPKALTQEGVRFADLKKTDYGLLAVGEIHQENGQVDNFLALIDLSNGSYKTIASGADFYASPALSSDGKLLVWLTWNHPNMPWDGTELWIADFIEGELKNQKVVAGGKTESIFQPQWSQENILYYISDKTGWWNLYRYNEDGSSENIWPLNGEFGLPLWVFGMSTYAFDGDRILCTYCQQGIWSLALINTKTGEKSKLDLPGIGYSQIRAGDSFAAFLMSSTTQPVAIVRLDLETSKLETLSTDEKIDFDPAYFSIGRPISYPSGNVRKAYAFYYTPQNKDCRGLRNELPPLIVRTHGGPTAMVTSAFDYRTLFWTSRGFAVLDVNYSGSTGYGRAYRDSLKGNWGISDVEDCEYGARFLAEKGLADPKRMAITGGSAGGYTTLCALTFGNTFSAGASHYGVSDLTALAKDTHKYEAHYLDSLVGPYPEREDLYQARSPIQFVEKLQRPVIFFQGAEDKIVPPDQSEKMYNYLRKRGVPTRFILYEGEQHGFRKAENMKDALEKELEFYLLVFCPKHIRTCLHT